MSLAVRNSFANTISFGSILALVKPIDVYKIHNSDTKGLDDAFIKARDHFANDGLDREICIVEVKDPKIDRTDDNFPQFILELFSKISKEILGLATEVAKGSVLADEIPVQVKVTVRKSEDLIEAFETGVKDADKIAQDVEYEIQRPSFRVKPDKLKDYREKLLLAADSTYHRDILEVAKFLAVETEKLIKKGCDFDTAFKTAEIETFEKVLTENNYEGPCIQSNRASIANRAKKLLKEFWEYGDKIK